MGQNLDMLTLTLTVLGCTQLFLGHSWVYFRVNFISCNSQCMFPKVVPKLASSPDNIGDNVIIIIIIKYLYRAYTFQC